MSSLTLPKPSFQIHIKKLSDYLKDNLENCDGIVVDSSIKVIFIGSPTQQAIDDATAYIESLTEEGELAKFTLTQMEQCEKIVSDAKFFANKIENVFIAENIMMGITQAGKTREVSEYLIDVLGYLRTGSLYEVKNEVDALLLAGIPEELAPFVTEERLEEFKAKIVDYLA